MGKRRRREIFGSLKRRKEREMREDAEIRKKIRIEEEERERVRREFVSKRKKRKV